MMIFRLQKIKFLFIDLLLYRCKHMLTLDLSYFDSNFGRQSFSYAAPRYWNALPVELRFLNNLDTFKKNIKTYLFNNFSVLKSKAFVYQQWIFFIAFLMYVWMCYLSIVWICGLDDGVREFKPGPWLCLWDTSGYRITPLLTYGAFPHISH